MASNSTRYINACVVHTFTKVWTNEDHFKEIFQHYCAMAEMHIFTCRASDTHEYDVVTFDTISAADKTVSLHANNIQL